MQIGALPAITPGVATPTPTPASGPAKQLGTSFQQALDSLSQSEANSNLLLEQLAAGEDVDLHQAMVAMEETDVNFRVAIAIRDRLVEAYREVMRMAV